MEFLKDLFYWKISPPTELRHLSLNGCCGGSILAARNLTSFDFVGNSSAPMKFDQFTFLPFISGSPSLESLSLSQCYFPAHEQLSGVTPVTLLKLKSLHLMDIRGLPGFPCLMDVPAFKTLSSLRISTHTSYSAGFLVHAESGDGFQLSYDTFDVDTLASDWLGVTYNADPSPAVIRFEGREPKPRGEWDASPLSLFTTAKILEIGASFADLWYRSFWKDVGKVGPQLTTLRLEVVEVMEPAFARSVGRLVRGRFNKGMPLAKLERMRFEGMSEESEEKAERLWEEFRAGLDIDQYLVPQ